MNVRTVNCLKELQKIFTQCYVPIFKMTWSKIPFYRYQGTQSKWNVLSSKMNLDPGYCSIISPMTDEQACLK